MILIDVLLFKYRDPGGWKVPDPPDLDPQRGNAVLYKVQKKSSLATSAGFLAAALRAANTATEGSTGTEAEEPVRLGVELKIDWFRSKWLI